MWLEIDGHDVIIGVHSDKSESPNKWVESKNDEAMPGDTWKKGKLKSVHKKPKPETEYQAKNSARRRDARRTITSHYSEWQQLNILREGDAEKIKMMGGFIDSVRSWSNTLSLPDKKLAIIVSEYFPVKNKIFTTNEK